MKIREIAFSCYPVTDMAKARSFYEGLLGLTATMDHKMEEGHWVEFDIGPYETPVCHMAFVRDPDGNSVGIHKRKPAHP